MMFRLRPSLSSGYLLYGRILVAGALERHELGEPDTGACSALFAVTFARSDLHRCHYGRFGADDPASVPASGDVLKQNCRAGHSQVARSIRYFELHLPGDEE